MNILLLTLMLAASPVTYIPAQDVTVGDGDTITATLVLTDDIQLPKQVLRAANYDAWESHKTRRSKPFSNFTEVQWHAELVKGVKAKEELTALLASGDLYVVLRGREVYGRILAEWYVYQKQSGELVSVAERMKAKGHTRK